ncbi:hypothetical protein [Clostridium perfringens]|uniref:hypothetical protein n=1 Tax=Clostridium perfringens TaxID=1502 RepID=UPI000D717FA8|nr:hypothetical protein [Clostridium perfringens]EGT3620858.1 hypothetical protein [Clostridium perfringens]PWX44921.1 hypothetical protein CYK61_15475 [Clostridium perfringens]HAT4129510.1 hypothetical protein [Clostridium perfringens]
MKFELRPSQYNFENKVNDNNYLELYITKGSFIKSYEKNKKQCYREFSYVIEMYTSPNCFECSVNIEAIDSIYEKLKSKNSYKGIIAGIQEILDTSNKLEMYRRHLFLAII